MKHLRPTRVAVALLALLAYLPALASTPGRMPADTKLYLYFSPGRLIRQAPFAWDTSQFGGWVPHQMISYLWPSGPFYWLLETLGFPDWVAHRLWIGTILFLAGTGVFVLARRLSLPVGAALVAAVVYQTTPFLLPYISRTSLMLLPYASLGWLCVAVWQAYRTGSWRWTAAAVLIIATIGGVNGTAFLMIVPGPVLLVAWEWAHGRLAHRRVLAVTARIAVLAIAISAWWATMLALQGRYGAAVLDYSETLEGVSVTSTSTEVLRSMGYWLAYIRDPYAAATTAALPYLSSSWLIVTSYAVPLLCLTGLLLTRWRYRGLAALLFATGLVLGVGFHPFADPAPLLAPLRDSGLGLALRSSTRALPLLVLGTALSAGALVTAVRVRRPRPGRVVSVAFVALAVINLPSLWRAQYVDPALERDQDAPAAWREAVTDIESAGTDRTARILQIPGTEFGAFRWGYTVDPPLPGLIDRPVVTRDLLPLGSPGVMDLAYALDNRFQRGAFDTAAVAPVARLLGAGDVWVTNDVAFDRFRTPRPERFAAEMSAAIDGLGPVRTFGTPAVNVADLPMVDEERLSDPLVGTPIPTVELRSVEGPAPEVATASGLVVVDGSGDGVVDAAAAGLLSGREALVYANDLDGEVWDALPPTTRFIVTDSNRDRSQQWRGSQDGLGMTESGGPGTDGVRTDAQDQRLPLFATDDPTTQTRSTFDGGGSVQATAYGEAFAYLPEYRAAMAVDGDPRTAWLVGQRFAPIGETLTLDPAPADGLVLRQPDDPTARQMITVVTVEQPGTAPVEVSLDERSLTDPGQPVPLRGSGAVTVRIVAIGERPGAPRTGSLFVGFSEIGPVLDEYIRPPQTVLDRGVPSDRLAIVFERDRLRATNRWRSDPEPRLAREFELTASVSAPLTVTLGLDRRADDDALDALAGRSGPTSNRRLTGVPDARAASAFDDDPATAWTSPFAAALGSELHLEVAEAATGPLTLRQPTDDLHSTITELTLTTSAGSAPVPVPAPDATGASELVLPLPVQGDVTLTVTGVAPADTVDRRYGDLVELPVAITELDGLQPIWRSTTSAACRDDLLLIDGRPIPLLVTDPSALGDGTPITATTCDGAPISLAPGTHRIVAARSATTGITVDRVVLGTPGAGDAATARVPADDIRPDGPTRTTAALQPCPTGCWVIFRQGHNVGWTATVDGRSLGEPRQVDGGVNGWWLPPTTEPVGVTFRFEPQRTLDVALAISAITALGCLLALLWPRRRRSDAPEPAPAPTFAHPAEFASRRRSVVAAGLMLLATTAFIAPQWLAPAAVVAAALVLTRTLRWAAWCAWIGMGLLTVMVFAREIRHPIEANAGWPGAFGDLHRPMLWCAMLLVACVLATSGDEVVDTDADDHHAGP